MTRKILLCNLIRGWFTGSLTKPRKGKRDSAQQLKLLELESRVVPASAVFANNTLTINLTAGDYFDYFNEYRDSANGNAVTDTAGYFKLSKYSSNTGFSPLKWSGLTDSTGTWKITQVGDGTTGDSLQLAPNKSIDGINIVVKGSSSTTEGCYFRANPDKKDGLFTGFVETDSLVDDTVVQDYPFISQNDIRFLGTTVSAYSDITSTKNITISTSTGFFYLEGSRNIKAGGAGFNLAINSTIEGATSGGAGNPSNRAILSNPGGTVFLGGGCGTYVSSNPPLALDGLDVTGSAISLKGAFHYASDFMRFHGPVTLEANTVLVTDNELLLEQGITSGATARSLAIEVNGGGVATVNALAGGATALFSTLDLRPIAGSDGAKVNWAGNLKTTATSGVTIKLSVPVYLNGPVKLETTSSSTTDLALTGSIQSMDPANPSSLDIKTLQMTVSGKVGDENPLASFNLTGSLKTGAPTSISAVGDIVQSGNSNDYKIVGKLSANSQKGSITLPNYVVRGDKTTDPDPALDLSAPEGKLNLYTGTAKSALTLADLKLNSRDGIALGLASLTATGPGGIWIKGPLSLAADTALNATDAKAPISVGGLEGSTPGGQSLTITPAGGAVTILSGIGQTKALKNFTVDKTSNLTVSGAVKADSSIFLKFDGVALEAPINSPTITVQNLTAGKTLALGTNSGADITLDSIEVANLIGGQVNLGKSDSGLITVGGSAVFHPGITKLQILAPAGIATLNGGGISVETLAISASTAGKDVTLSGANSVKNLAGQFANDLIFSNLGALALGAGTTPFTVGRNATLSATGPISQGAVVSVGGVLGLTATGGLGQEQDITLTNAANSMPVVSLGYAGDVKLVAGGDLKLSQKTVTEGSATVPALIGSLDATAGTANKVWLGSNLDISGPIKLVSGAPIPLSTDTQIRSTAQSGDGIFIKGTIVDATGKNLVLDAGGGSLVVDGISLSGGTSALTIPSLGGTSSIGTLKTGPVTIQNGTGTLDLNSPETNSLSISSGTLAVTIDSLAKVAALSAYNTGITTLGSTGTSVIAPAGTVVNKLAVANGVTTLSFPGGGTILGAFTVSKGLTLAAGDGPTDSLIIPGGLIIASGGGLNGSGKLDGNVTVQSGAIYAPTDHTITGNLDLLGTLQVAGNTTSVGNGPLTVNGVTNINGAKLEVVNAGGIKPSKGSVILGIENGPNGSLNGTFAGQAEGSKLTSPTGMYLVSYANGDVSLTAADEPIKRGIYGVAVMGGATGKSRLDIFENGTETFIRSVDAFPGFRGEFYVDSGDVTGDGVEDIIVGSGNGSMNGHVVLFDGARLLVPGSKDTGYLQGGTVLASLYAFINYSSGVAVRLAEVTGDGVDDIVLSPGTGAGTTTQSHLRVWDGKLSLEQFRAGDPFSSYNYAKWELASFYAFGGNGAPGGGMAISVIRKQGGDQIVASQLFGGGMRVFEYNTQTRSKELTIVADLTGTLLATGNTVVGLNSPSNERFYVTAGTAAGSSDTLYLRNKDGGIIRTQTNVFAGAKGGMRVSIQNLDEDSQDELLVIRDSTAEVAIYDITFSDSSFFLARKGQLSRGGAGGWV